MTLDDMKKALAESAAKFAELEEAARTLKNQNFADIAAAAKRRIEQLTEHPDLERVHAVVAPELVPAPEALKAVPGEQVPLQPAPFPEIPRE